MSDRVGSTLVALADPTRRGIVEVLARDPGDNGSCEALVRDEVAALCARFPIYPGPDLSRGERV